MAMNTTSHMSERDDQKSSNHESSDDQKLIERVSNIWRDIRNKKTDINWLSTTLDDEMQFKSFNMGHQGLYELQEHILKTHRLDGIALLVLRCESKPESDSSAKFVFGRCIGSHVSSKHHEGPRLLEPEIASIFDVRHLNVDTDETMKGWTQKELIIEFTKVCGGQLESIHFGSGEYLKLPSKPPKSLKKSAMWQGFKSDNDAEDFGRKYYKEILSAMTSPEPMSELRECTMEYIERNAIFVGNGEVFFGIDSWERVCGEFAERFGPTSASLVDLQILTLSRLSFVASFEISFGFADRSTTTNKGTVSVMMSPNKKIMHIVEASKPPSLRSIQKKQHLGACITMAAKDV